MLGRGATHPEGDGWRVTHSKGRASSHQGHGDQTDDLGLHRSVVTSIHLSDGALGSADRCVTTAFAGGPPSGTRNGFDRPLRGDEFDAANVADGSVAAPRLGCASDGSVPHCRRRPGSRSPQCHGRAPCAGTHANVIHTISSALKSLTLVNVGPGTTKSPSRSKKL